MFDTQLHDPPELVRDTLRITPLGGLGEIGRNMTAFEINGEILLIDAGVMFPEQAHPGVDLILPNFDAITDRLDDVVGLVLTHGHEDHIGAVPYLLKTREDIEVFGSKLTLALLDPKLKEHQIQAPKLTQICENTSIKVGTQFDIEFIAVNHSIPDALAVFLRTVGGTVLHTGDFKMDQRPLDGRLTDLRAFARLGEAGVDLLMIDSTNAEIQGFTPGELDIESALKQVFDQTTGKIVVACFASHVHRVQQVMKQAELHGRVVAYDGRSMVRNMGIARDLGFLKVPAATLVEISEVDGIPKNQLVIICTGSQGEPLSALSRMATARHSNIKIEKGDTVLLASSLIPGNENSVFGVINGLVKQQAWVVHKGNALVHASGHACSGELLYCYNIIQPKNVIPIHGEPRHLVANAALAQSAGIDNVFAIEDGTVVDLIDHQAHVVGRIDASYILVDGTSVGSLSEESLADRRILGLEGMVTVVAVVSEQKVVSVDIEARGFIDGEGVFLEVEPLVQSSLEAVLSEGVTDIYLLQQNIKRTFKRWASATLKSRPMILPIVIYS